MSDMGRDTDVAVVIATRNRRDDLARCISALHGQVDAPPFEVVVVDDGSSPPLGLACLEGVAPVRIVRTVGVGPSAARNLGVETVSGDLVLFTDDDAVPSDGWVSAAVARLRAHPTEVAVTGPIFTPDYDSLRAYSVSSPGPGHYWTCNIAYRRAIFERLQGFDEEAFPFFGEDLDLAFRALDLGPIGYASSMSVVHTPRELGIGALIRQGRWVSSELALARRHPTRVPASRMPLPGAAVSIVGHARNWQRRWRRERAALLRDPLRLVRFLVIAGGHMTVVVTVAVKVSAQGPRGRVASPVAPRKSRRVGTGFFGLRRTSRATGRNEEADME